MMVHKWEDSQFTNSNWTKRTILVSQLMIENKDILDLGCGKKEILKYYKSKSYIGVDIREDADLIINLKDNFIIPGTYDYVLCCGILEYIDDIELFFKKIMFLGKEFIITWWPKNIYIPMSEEDFEKSLNKYFLIIQKKTTNTQFIYKCKKIEKV